MKQSIRIKIIPAKENLKKYQYLIEDAKDNIHRAISMRLDILHDLHERGKLSDEVIKQTEVSIHYSQMKLIDYPIHDVKSILDYWLLARNDLALAVDQAKKHLEEYSIPLHG